MQVGDLELSVVSDGSFRLDGGSMFGIIPKVLWEKDSPADERNRIRLGLNCLVVQSAEEVILVDTGIGDMYDEKFAFLYAVDKAPGNLLANLASLGLQPEDVDKVILSHLHFDHCGGNCRRDPDGKLVPTFPRATYYINEGELANARRPDVRSRASYLAHTWEPLEEHGQMAVTADNEQISPGVQLIATPGHTEFHQSVLVQSEDRTVCFLADVVPTTSHLKTACVMGFDLFPLVAMESKSRILARARDEEWLLIFEHDPDCVAGYLHDELALEPLAKI